MKTPGLFCVFEGIDGAGKSTLLAALKSFLADPEHDAASLGFSGALFLREPTDLPTGREIRRRLTGAESTSRAEWLDLFLLDRALNVDVNIGPARASGHLIIQDRYFYSTAAYQGKEDEPPGPADIVQMNLDRGFPVPDLVFYLDIDVETALSRITARGEVSVFEERETLTAMDRRFRSVLPASTVFLDTRRPPEELAAGVLRAIRGNTL